MPSIPAPILETIIARLAPLFLAGARGDLGSARAAAGHLLASYGTETIEELRLAANIVTLGFHFLEALGQASMPDMPITRIIRLRSGAVALSRECRKTEQQLERLRKTRNAPALAPHPKPAAPTPGEPIITKPVITEPETVVQPEVSNSAEKAMNLVTDTRQVAALAAETRQTWTQAYRQRLRDQRLAKRAAKQQASMAAAPVANPADIAPAQPQPAAI